ncbi:helix-turn-helix transcriptional regulator [Micromonospora sp. NPDC051196]|uniref:helix-turn-helix domain-containing protein n=1 Tax=Micromonospora sp. NPDC051196 TaxID=3155281 RepID=UPI00344621AB
MHDAARSPVPQAATAGEYVGLLRDIRRGSGLTYREISRRASAAGHWLPPSTLATMLGRTTLPRERTVVALLAACGTPAAVIEQWVGLRREIDVRLNEPTRWVAAPTPPACCGVPRPAVDPGRSATTYPPSRRLQAAAIAGAGVLVGAYGMLLARRRGGHRRGEAGPRPVDGPDGELPLTPTDDSRS